MSAPAGLRIFGFPLHVRPGFALLLVLVVVVNSGPIGLWLALKVVGFVLKVAVWCIAIVAIYWLLAPHLGLPWPF